MDNKVSLNFISAQQDYNRLKRAVDEFCNNIDNSEDLLLSEKEKNRLICDARLLLDRYCKLAKAYKKYCTQEFDLKHVQKINTEIAEYKLKLNTIIDKLNIDLNV